MLAVLAGDSDEMVAPRAATALLTTPVESFVAALKRPDVAPPVFRYCAENLAEKPGVADAMAENTSCPPDLLVEVAPYLKEAVEALVEDLDRLTSNPSLVTALAPCASLNLAQRSILKELQKDGTNEAAYSDAAAAAEIARVPEAERPRRMSLYQRVAKMRVIERVQLALKGGREERMLLIRDSNKLVQRGVLQSPRITDQEVESFAAMTSVSEEVLRRIASNRAFMKNYIIARNLITNPKTPLDISLQQLPRLNAQDLKFLTMNKNVPETLRTMATKLQRQRSASKPGGGG